MITYSIIQKSQLEGALRLDAEYYQPEYLDAEKKIAKIKHKTIKNLAEKVFSGPFGSTLKSESYQERGVPFIRIGDISNVFIDKKNLVYISPEEHKRIFSTHLKPGDIVFSKIGTIGKLSVISDDLGEVNISENNIGIRFSKLPPSQRTFLLFFLLSKYGQAQIMRKGSGNIQQKLNVIDIETIKAPEVNDNIAEEFFNVYKRIIKLRKQGKNFYSQAENLLLEGLGLKDFEVKDEIYNVVNLSDVKSTSRIDAEYFQVKYDEIISKIKNVKKLGDLVEMEKGIEVGSERYEDEGKPFLRVSNMSKQGFVSSNQKYLCNELYQKLKNTSEPKIGEVLLTKDATPGVAYVVKEAVEGIIAGGILRLKLKTKIEPEYLALVINSIVGQMQVERDTGGSVIVHWRPGQIKNCLIPILSKPTQQKIADLVQKSHQARKEAKQLLEQAKQKVEDLIEK